MEGRQEYLVFKKKKKKKQRTFIEIKFLKKGKKDSTGIGLLLSISIYPELRYCNLFGRRAATIS